MSTILTIIFNEHLSIKVPSIITTIITTIIKLTY